MNPFTRSALALVPLACTLTPLAAQTREYDQEEMAKSFAEMQAEPWFENGGWLLDFDAAKAEAEKTGKPIFAYFTRTYAY
ncbi:MAG: hypothetical protein KDE27_02270 [Planctomycetes bacterium]|nr:hypothetical protein [Planctomycetota bacterium]